MGQPACFGVNIVLIRSHHTLPQVLRFGRIVSEDGSGFHRAYLGESWILIGSVSGERLREVEAHCRVWGNLLDTQLRLVEKEEPAGVGLHVVADGDDD